MSTYNGPWADEKPLNTNCVVTSCLNGENVESDGAQPHSDAEVNRLRALSGDTVGGESLAAGDLALQRAYGRKPHAAASTRTAIEIALGAGHWIAVIGMIGALPVRLQTQTKSVSHCVLIGPAGQIVDPEDVSNAGHPGTRHISRAETDTFAASGGYDALVFVPHVYAEKSTHGHVVVKGRSSFYHRHGSGPYTWTRDPANPHTFAADTTLARLYPNVFGRSHRMVKITEGVHRGAWLNTTGLGVTYSEEV
jgi:hypothetical protein